MVDVMDRPMIWSARSSSATAAAARLRDSRRRTPGTGARAAIRRAAARGAQVVFLDGHCYRRRLARRAGGAACRSRHRPASAVPSPTSAPAGPRRRRRLHLGYVGPRHGVAQQQSNRRLRGALAAGRLPGRCAPATSCRSASTIPACCAYRQRGRGAEPALLGLMGYQVGAAQRRGASPLFRDKPPTR